MRSDEEILAFIDEQVAKLQGVQLRTDWERQRAASFDIAL